MISTNVATKYDSMAGPIKLVVMSLSIFFNASKDVLYPTQI
jgi:hypothetical protein